MRPLPVEPSPVSGLLRRLQTNAGWGALVDDGMKRRLVHRLESIALDDDVSPATQVAAIAGVMKASSLELETVNTLAKLYEVTELERRIEELQRRVEPPKTDDGFVELEPPTEPTDLDDPFG